jgi:hypothetical protein
MLARRILLTFKFRIIDVLVGINIRTALGKSLQFCLKVIDALYMSLKIVLNLADSFSKVIGYQICTVLNKGNLFDYSVVINHFAVVLHIVAISIPESYSPCNQIQNVLAV